MNLQCILREASSRGRIHQSVAVYVPTAVSHQRINVRGVLMDYNLAHFVERTANLR